MVSIQAMWIQQNYIQQTWIFMLVLISSVVLATDTVYRVDPLALLSGTLRTNQKSGCDFEAMSMSCPRGTSISIEVAQYVSKIKGNAICPQSTVDSNLKSATGVSGGGIINGISSSSSSSSGDVDVGGGNGNGVSVGIDSGGEDEPKYSEMCLPNALQYSLLQNVVETCQKKSHCKFTTSPSTNSNQHGVDPCPEKQKYIEVSYKCRPYEFRSKVACENEVIQLVCNPYSRIAIYSASFGRTEYESIQCAQPQGVMEENCVVSYATETVMDVCHGRRRCTITADSSTFGNPCRSESKVYLKIVYTCIPRKVLKERYDYTNEPDEPLHIDPDQNQDDLYDEDQFYRESEAFPPAPKLHRELSKPPDTSQIPSMEITPSTTINTPMKTREKNHLEENQFYIYLCISVGGGILLCLALVLGQHCMQKRFQKKDPNIQTSNTGETTLPNGFSDDISEIDVDIDLNTPYQLSNVSQSTQSYNMYTPSPNQFGTLRPSQNHPNMANMATYPTKTMSHSRPYAEAPPSTFIGVSADYMYPSPATVTVEANSIKPCISNLPPPVYIGHQPASLDPSTILRRPQREYGNTPPRILSNIDVDQQYYYG